MSPREQRKRKVSERLRNVGAGAIIEARGRQLDALEDDNHAMEQEARLLEGEEEYQPGQATDEDEGVFQTSRKKRRTPGKSRARERVGRRRAANKGSTFETSIMTNSPSGGFGVSSKRSGVSIERWNMSLARMLQEEEGYQRPRGMIAFADLTAAPSKVPARPFCAVCGYAAAYTCTRCASRFCSIRCGGIHEQTQCLKVT